jgi:hypothetical protein
MTLTFRSLSDLPPILRGPLAVVLAEDEVELAATLAHNRRLGFFAQVVLLAPGVRLPEAAEGVTAVQADLFARDAVPELMSRLIAILPEETWVHWCYNGEFLFYPQSETRPVTALLSFHAEERRDAMQAHVIDLYAADLTAHPNGVDRATAHLDRMGYFAAGRRDPANHNYPKDRQLDIFGGLRWRFEEHVPAARRNIARVSLFRARKGLRMRPDFLFSDEEYNTYACPWHSNLTAAVASFRAAKALRDNPASARAVRSFMWEGSEPFRWQSHQLLDLGMMEAGQWF